MSFEYHVLRPGFLSWVVGDWCWACLPVFLGVVMTELVACVGCGAMVPDIDGPTHRYLGASPGCWQIYGEVLAGKDGVMPHRLLVDVYAAQHPGVEGKQSSQSVAA